MNTLDNLTVTKEFVKRNQTLLHLGAIAGLVVGVGAWSITPFVASDRHQILVRTLGSAAGILGGIFLITCGNDLERIRPFAKAVRKAEEDIFIHGVAASQYGCQQQLDDLAEIASQLTYSLPDESLSGASPELIDTLASASPTYRPEVREVPPEATYSTSTSLPQTSQLPCDVETYQKVREAISEGKSMTFIVEKVLGMGAKQFNKGKALYLEIEKAIALESRAT